MLHDTQCKRRGIAIILYYIIYDVSVSSEPGNISGITLLGASELNTDATHVIIILLHVHCMLGAWGQPGL